MSEHTPGPWQIESRFVGPLVITAECRPEIDKSGKLEIAHVGAETFMVANANARLIAAAPDLLAALEDILKVAEADLALTSNPHPMREAVVNSARAAIAKARGEP